MVKSARVSLYRVISKFVGRLTRSCDFRRTTSGSTYGQELDDGQQSDRYGCFYIFTSIGYTGICSSFRFCVSRPDGIKCFILLVA